MSLSDAELRDLVGGASSIDERLRGDFRPRPDRDPEAVRRRLEAWRRSVAGGDARAFARRLRFDGLDLADAERVLESVVLAQDVRLPGWCATLEEVLLRAREMSTASAQGAEQGVQAPASSAAPALPFEPMLWPFARVADARLRSLSGASHACLSAAAHASLLRSLLEALGAAAGPALLLELGAERAAGDSPLALFGAEDSGDAHYTALVERLLAGELERFFLEYPVLARVMATTTELWVDAVAELCARLEADRERLCHFFELGSDVERGAPAQVVAIQGFVSDAHAGRRSVMLLGFANGRKVVYKPRNVEIELAYNRLLAFLNQHGAPLVLHTFAVLPRGDYGFIEFVTHEPCADRAAAGRYYERAGMLLSLVHLLEGTDCHFENVVAHGEHPVLIDVETLLHPRERREPFPEPQASALVRDRIGRSALRTGLVPGWRTPDGERTFDTSAFGASRDQPLSTLEAVWSDVNTDRMTLAYRPVPYRTSGLPEYADGAALRLAEHGEDFLRGYRSMQACLERSREALLAADSPLCAFAPLEVRYVYRSTHVYRTLARRLHDPELLRDGADRSIQLEQLGRALLSLETEVTEPAAPPRFWPAFAAERGAMEREDVPCFWATAGGNRLLLDDGSTIEGCFEAPSLELAFERLRALGREDDAAFDWIQAALEAHAAPASEERAASARATIRGPVRTTGRGSWSARDSDALVAEALAVARAIEACAVRGDDGSAAWPSTPPTRELALLGEDPSRALGHDLYGGSVGVALFLAALERVAGAGFRELALGALQPLLFDLRTAPSRTADELGIGGARGLGSVVYALTQLGRLLDAPELLAAARAAAELIEPARIAADRALDVTHGAAGALLGLLSLVEATQDALAREHALACGRHVVNQLRETSTGARAWRTRHGRFLTGFSHGAAGIAYALARLYRTSGDTELLEAAAAGIAYEHASYDPSARNWRDLRSDRPDAFMNAWCHGAAGIALARLGGLAALDGENARADLDAGLRAAVDAELSSADQLCCGNAGRIAILDEAGRTLGRPELSQAAHARLHALLARARETGGYALTPRFAGRLHRTSLFQGTARIGYACLRLARPELVPNLLLWQ